jgi:hypothetical protein
MEELARVTLLRLRDLLNEGIQIAEVVFEALGNRWRTR